MSWRFMSIIELDKIIPVRPPIVNIRINPIDHMIIGVKLILLPFKVKIHLKILILVGTAIIIVADIKYNWVSISKPIVNIWWAQTINPKIPIDNIA